MIWLPDVVEARDGERRVVGAEAVDVVRPAAACRSRAERTRIVLVVDGERRRCSPSAGSRRCPTPIGTAICRTVTLSPASALQRRGPGTTSPETPSTTTSYEASGPGPMAVEVGRAAARSASSGAPWVELGGGDSGVASSSTMVPVPGRPRPWRSPGPTGSRRKNSSVSVTACRRSTSPPPLAWSPGAKVSAAVGRDVVAARGGGAVGRGEGNSHRAPADRRQRHP